MCREQRVPASGHEAEEVFPCTWHSGSSARRSGRRPRPEPVARNRLRRSELSQRSHEEVPVSRWSRSNRTRDRARRTIQAELGLLLTGGRFSEQPHGDVLRCLSLPVSEAKRTRQSLELVLKNLCEFSDANLTKVWRNLSTCRWLRGRAFKIGGFVRELYSAMPSLRRALTMEAPGTENGRPRYLPVGALDGRHWG